MIKNKQYQLYLVHIHKLNNKIFDVYKHKSNSFWNWSSTNWATICNSQPTQYALFVEHVFW